MTDQTGGTPSAGELTADQLAAEVEKLAKSGLFQQAEETRARLLELHPMAISQIVAAAEVIEEEKSAQLDHDHVALWDELYSSLSPEEKNALFYSSKSANIAQGKLLFVQGKKNNRLFFVDSGRVTLFHTRAQERKFLGQLSRGDIVGEESFFHITYPTCSAGCQSEVKLRYLDRAILKTWKDQFPGLAQKLADFCRSHGRTGECVQSQNFEKRSYDRREFEGRITVHILDAENERSGKYFKGTLNDISRSGMNFSIRCSRSETAQALLGRVVDLEMEEHRQAGLLRGLIVRVSFHLHSDYSVHVQLSRLLEEDEVASLAG